jgi:hypothetical protein
MSGPFTTIRWADGDRDGNIDEIDLDLAFVQYGLQLAVVS